MAFPFSLLQEGATEKPCSTLPARIKRGSAVCKKGQTIDSFLSAVKIDKREGTLFLLISAKSY